jgi:hypothetical protein
MPNCRSCRADIIWANTAAGRLIPLDIEPSADGNVTLTTSSPIVATVLGPLELQLLDADTPRYKTHFVDCPDGKSWRK